MTTVADILNFVETIAPSYMKEDWDRVGLNCGHLQKEVSSVLIALDPFESVCHEAKEFGVDLLITHHALLWNAGFLTDDQPQGRNALYLIENGIAHMNAHTNLDCAPGGVNDVLASQLGLENIQVIHPKGTDIQNRPWGLLRQGKISPMPLEDFLKHVKERLDCEGLRYVDCGKPVSRIAVGGGACASELMEAVQAGCDTFITADVKYNQFWDAKNAGINLIDAGHFHTENPVVACLASQIRTAFPEIQVYISQKHTDCTKFFC